MVRVAAYDPGRIRDSLGMVAADVSEKEILLLNAKEWKKTNFVIAEQQIADINERHPFDRHICETNNQGWHVIDNMRSIHGIPVIGVNTSKSLTAKTARLGKSLDKNAMVEWIDWARDKGVVKFPSGQWSQGITELSKQLNRFVMKKTSSGYKYEAAESDDHDDLVLALVVLCHYARMKILNLGNIQEPPLGMGPPEDDMSSDNVFVKNIRERLQSSGMKLDEIETPDEW